MSEEKKFYPHAPYFDHGKAALEWAEHRKETDSLITLLTERDAPVSTRTYRFDAMPPRYMHDETTSEEDLEIIYPERNKL